jgi:hypothetical protein
MQGLAKAKKGATEVKSLTKSKQQKLIAAPAAVVEIALPVAGVLIDVCVFRLMPGHSSGACRAGIPVHAGPPFRRMPGRGV